MSKRALEVLNKTASIISPFLGALFLGLAIYVSRDKEVVSTWLQSGWPDIEIALQNIQSGGELAVQSAYYLGHIQASTQIWTMVVATLWGGLLFLPTLRRWASTRKQVSN
jgi:hypothetical protein